MHSHIGFLMFKNINTLAGFFFLAEQSLSVFNKQYSMIYAHFVNDACYFNGQRQSELLNLGTYFMFFGY